MKALPTQIGPYKVIRKIGAGGMGVVLEAVHEKIERRVAIKLLHPQHAQNADVAERLFREALAVNRIAHPSVVQISEHGQMEDGAMYLVMEFLRGQTLSAWLKQYPGPAPVRTVLGIAAQVASALAAAHDKGIIHRDIKPGNLMLLEDEAGTESAALPVKILDFGIAKFSPSHEMGADAKTGTDLILGTPQYMSPEQCQGAGFVDAKSDVYSLGVVLFQLLAGRRPFAADGCGQLIALHLFQEPPLLSELAPLVPARLAELVQSLLAKDKSARPAMKELHVEFECMLRSGMEERVPEQITPLNEPAPTALMSGAVATTAKGPSERSPGLKRSQRSRRLIAGGLMVLVGLGGAGTAWRTLWPGEKPPAATRKRPLEPIAAPMTTGAPQPAYMGSSGIGPDAVVGVQSSSGQSFHEISAAQKQPETGRVQPILRANVALEQPLPPPRHQDGVLEQRHPAVPPKTSIPRSKRLLRRASAPKKASLAADAFPLEK